MLRIRQIYDVTMSVNQQAVSQIQEILRSQFPLLAQEDIDNLPEQLRNPLKYRFQSVLFAADFQKNGTMTGRLGMPVLVVQEGGYKNNVIGINARNFFRGLWSGIYG